MAEYDAPAASAAVSSSPKPKKGGDGEAEFLKIAKERFARAIAAESENRSNGIDDLKFKNGDQWPAQIKAQRSSERRPCLTINKMKTFVHQITNDQRQNRPSINVSPVGDKSDPETAKMLKGLIRQIERQSSADVAYDTAFDNAVSNGWGYWRILTAYESDTSFDQVIRVMRIRNPFRVYLDPDIQEPEGSDADWGFISDLIVREKFKAQHPKADPVDWADVGLGDEDKWWSTQTHVRIAEYFCYEMRSRKLLALNAAISGALVFEDELPEDMREAIRQNPALVVNEREVSQKTLKWYKMTGREILEENEWLGKWIPIVKVIGDETDVDGKVSLAGVVRDAKDPQRMYNFWTTAETELIALAPKAPWVMEEGQVEGHEQRWKEANNKSFPYLLYKGTSIAGKPSPPPQRQPFAGPPAAVVNAKMSAAQDMMAVTGIRFDSTLAERTYDESGRALRELKRVSDIGSFHYVDNLARSLRHTGRIFIDLIPKVYDTKRVLTILREDDKEEQVEIDPRMEQARGEGKTEDGRVRSIYNPKVGEYEVAVTIGPNFATKRIEAAESMLGFMKAVPQSGPVIGDLIAKNMDWPGAEEIAERLAASLPPNLQKMSVGKFPPEAQALIQSLTGQLEQMQQQHNQALAMLGDKEKDRQIERDKINADYAAQTEKTVKTWEAQMTKIAADMQEKLCARLDGQFEAVANQVRAMEEAYRKQQETDANIEALARQALGPQNVTAA